MNLKFGLRGFSISIPLAFLLACASPMPVAKHKTFYFPEAKVFIEEPVGADLNRPYKPLGWVRAKEQWSTLEQDINSLKLCQTYFNKGAHSLLSEAKKVGADAVIKVRSVVMLLDGKVQDYPTPECSDDGQEGEILMQGIAIKFLPKQVK